MSVSPNEVWEERWHPLRREGVIVSSHPEATAAELRAAPAVHYKRQPAPLDA